MKVNTDMRGTKNLINQNHVTMQVLNLKFDNYLLFHLSTFYVK